MKRSYLVLALAAAVAAGFFAGRIASPGPALAARQADESKSPALRKVRPNERLEAESARTPQARLRQEIRKLPAADVPPMVFRALETGDPILRRQLMSELYSRMDAGNYQQMMDEILRVSNETGREYPDEYLLMSLRAGQVAGQAVMDGWKEKGLEGEAVWKSFTGWSQTDPIAAGQWLENASDITPKTREKLLNCLVAGSTVNSPESAAKLLASLPPADRNACLEAFTNNIVQNAGKDAGVQWLRTLQSSGQDPDYTARATTSLFDRILWSGANRRNAASMVNDLERLSTIIPIDEHWISRSMGQIRDRKATGGIELLDGIVQSSVLRDQPITDRLWNSAIDFAIQRDRNAVSQWMAQNPQSPIYERVASTYNR